MSTKAAAAAAAAAAKAAAEFESAIATATTASAFNADLLTKLIVERKDIEEVLKARFFFDRSFSIYGGIAGLYDYGPNGCAVKANLLAFWRKFFILEDSMLEVDCTCVTPHTVLEASGHVEKFKDFMVKDVVTKEHFRADHLLEDHMEKLLENPKLDAALRDEYVKVKSAADSYSQQELGEKLSKYGVKAPKTKNDITEPFPFNLMFATSIGPGGDVPGFLRPELAQGIFLNFPRLLEANCGKVPFAAAQIGQAFRNEIAPRAGLLRVREFTLAEIEHFVKPNEKDHPKFESVKDLVVSLFPRGNQEGDRQIIRKTIGEAVATGIVGNETLGYYIARAYLFLTTSGIKPYGLRFRQHLQNEMAHYANDCWDAEILTTHGWIECVGIADRACYDLTVHSKKARLAVYEAYPEPIIGTVVECKPLKGQVAKKFGKDCQIISKHLEELSETDILALEENLKTNGSAKISVDNKEFEIQPPMVEIKKRQDKINGHFITPNVIEPSFGIGRIIYCLFEHAFNIRDARRILSLEPHLAPVKCSVLPLTSAKNLVSQVPRIVSLLTNAGLSSKVDTVQSIGRRYSRTDEIGIPFAITIDFDTEVDDTVTLRNRDSLGQIRVKVEECAQLVASVIDQKATWAELEAKYPKYEGKVEDDKE